MIGGMDTEIGDKRIDMAMATFIKNITNAPRKSVKHHAWNGVARFCDLFNIS